MNRIVFYLTRTFACLLIIFCGAITLLAQSSTATLSGTVEDEKGAVIPSAAVSVTDPEKGLKRQVVTNENEFIQIKEAWFEVFIKPRSKKEIAER